MSTPNDKLEDLERIFNEQLDLDDTLETPLSRAELEKLYKKLEAERKQKYKQSTHLTVNSCAALTLPNSAGFNASASSSSQIFGTRSIKIS